MAISATFASGTMNRKFAIALFVLLMFVCGKPFRLAEGFFVGGGSGRRFRAVLRTP